MAVFEVESWLVTEGKQEKHDEAIRRWIKWVNDHRELFKEWKSVRYFVKTVAGCLLYTSPSPRDRTRSRMPSSA